MRLKRLKVVARIRLVQVWCEPSQCAVFRTQSKTSICRVWVTPIGTDVVREVDVLWVTCSVSHLPMTVA